MVPPPRVATGTIKVGALLAVCVEGPPVVLVPIGPTEGTFRGKVGWYGGVRWVGMVCQ